MNPSSNGNLWKACSEFLKMILKKKIDLATLVQQIKEPGQISDSNYVKVAIDKEGFALYLSRAPIPHPEKQLSLQNILRI